MPNKPQKLTLPVLITRGAIVYPGTQTSLDAGRDFSMAAIDACRTQTDSLIFVVSQKEENVDNPTSDDIYDVGTLCHVLSVTERQNYYKVRIEGVERVKLEDVRYDETNKIYIGEGIVLPLPVVDEEKAEDIINELRREIDNSQDVLANMPKTVANLISRTHSVPIVCYSISSISDAPIKTKQAVLELNDIGVLVEYAKALIKGHQQKSEIERLINEDVRQSAEKSQREYFLREKLKAVKKELGEDGQGLNSPDAILERIEKEPYPEHVKKKVKAELKKVGS